MDPPQMAKLILSRDLVEISGPLRLLVDGGFGRRTCTDLKIDSRIGHSCETTDR